jgi:hypothetical protein
MDWSQRSTVHQELVYSAFIVAELKPQCHIIDISLIVITPLIILAAYIVACVATWLQAMAT